MKNDIQPSLVCACFTTPKAWANFQEEMKKNKMSYRELKLIDIGIELDNPHFEKQVNFLKRFTKPILRRFFLNIPFKSIIERQLQKVHLKFFDYDKFKCEADKKTPMAFLGFTPLFVDNHYKDKYTKEEKRNLKKLHSLQSDSYKPTPLEEQGIIEDESKFDMSRCG